MFGVAWSIDSDSISAAGTASGGTSTTVAGDLLNLTIKNLSQAIYVVSYKTTDSNIVFIAVIYSSDGTPIKYLSNGVPYTLQETGAYMNVFAQVSNGKTVNGKIYDIQLEINSVPTPYEPYRGSTITLPFGQTVYGGELDWTTGVLTVDWISHTFNAADIVSKNWQPTDTSMSAVIRVTSAAALPVQTSTEIPNVLCTSLKTISYGDIFSVRVSEMAISRVQGGADNRFVVRLPLSLAETAADIKSWLIDNAVEIAYQIAEPITIQLTPQEILALPGANTLYTDGDRVTIAGKQDLTYTLRQIQEQLAAVSGVTEALTGTD